GLWTKTFEFEINEIIEYKITRGSWEKEALDEDNTIRQNAVLVVTGDTTIYIEVPKWKDEVQNARRKVKGQITGKVIIHKDMSDDGIIPRDVIVWLPPSYEKEKDKRFPVMYMHDGQQIIDPATSTHGIDWQIDETITKLVAEGKMQEIIVVGIYSTQNRYKEYSDGELGRLYQNFIVKKLKPFIDKTYRTLPEREYTSVMGSSMGGIASFLLIWHYPEIFSMAGCFSPAFFLDWNELKNSEFPKAEYPVKIYIDNGGVGLEKRLQPGCDLMLEVLQAKGFELGKNLLWYQDKEASHCEEEWGKRAWMPILFQYGIGEQNWIKDLPAPHTPIYSDLDNLKKEIVEFDTITIAGIMKKYNVDRKDDLFDLQWKTFIEKIDVIDEIKKIKNLKFVGLEIFDDLEENNYSYFCGIIIEEDLAIPLEIEKYRIASSKYIKFQIKSLTVREGLQYLIEWYLPRNNYKRKKEGILITGELEGNKFLAKEIYVPIEIKY
ncbi:MAG TPA: alpha/beta hydrolase-fold protein, partial [bacterium]|nr:alpha/beta hydrolase-fold protein [bacterium]